MDVLQKAMSAQNAELVAFELGPRGGAGLHHHGDGRAAVGVGRRQGVHEQRLYRGEGVPAGVRSLGCRLRRVLHCLLADLQGPLC